MDVIADLAYPLPVTVIAEMLGIPVADRDASRCGPMPSCRAAKRKRSPQALATTGANWYGEMVDYFSLTIEARRAAPRDDLISALIAAQVDGEHLTMQELIGFCILLLVAGNETTTNLLGNALLCFDEYPDTEQHLRDAPQTLPTAIEEVLRYRAPVPMMFARGEGGRTERPARPRRERDDRMDRLREPRRRAVPRAGPLRHHAHAEPASGLWLWHPFLPGCAAGPPRGAHRARGDVSAHASSAACAGGRTRATRGRDCLWRPALADELRQTLSCCSSA